MSLSARWYDPHHSVVLITLDRDWKLDSLGFVDDRAIEMIESVATPVDIVVDVRDAVPALVDAQRSLQYLRNFAPRLPYNKRHSIYITSDYDIHELLKTYYMMTRRLHVGGFRIVDSMPKALDALRVLRAMEDTV